MSLGSSELAGMRTNRFALVGQGEGQTFVPVPFGMQISGRMKVRIVLDAKGHPRRITIPELENVLLFPPYEATERTKQGKLSIRLLSQYSEKYEVLQLLSELHYRRYANGMILGAYLAQTLVGCAVMGRLTFGRPRKRLEYLRRSDPRMTAPRAAKKPILWVRRFATASNMSGCGIATALAKHVCLLARDYFRPQPEFVEVITSRPLTEIEQKGEVLKRDFLIRAGYELVGIWPEVGKLDQRWNSDKGDFERERVKYFYYVHRL